LRPAARSAFTFIDPRIVRGRGRYNANNLVWRLEREIFLEKKRETSSHIDVPGLAARSQDAEVVCVSNG
jgi:hypothetical protein